LDLCRKGLVQTLLDFPLKKIITGFPFEKRSSRMDMSDYAAPIQKKGDGGPAAIVFVEPPTAQRFPMRIDCHRELEAKLAGLSFYIGQT
jgi:hypothetical protein